MSTAPIPVQQKSLSDYMAEASQAPSKGQRTLSDYMAEATGGTPGKFTTGFSEGMGFSRPDLSIGDMLREAVGGIVSNAKSSYSDWKGGLDRELPGGPPKSKYDPFTYINPALAAAATPIDMLAKGIEGTASTLEKGGKEIASGETERGSGRMLAGLGQLAMGKEASEAPRTAATVAEAPRQALQHLAGVGPELTEKAVETRQAAIDTSTAKFQEKAATIGEANKSARESAMQRQQLTDEARGHAQDLGNRLSTLKEQEKAFAKALYPDVQGSAASTDILNGVSNAVDSNLRGTGRVPTALARIMDDLKPETNRTTGPQIGGRFLDLSNPDDFRAFQRLKSQGVFSTEELARMEGQHAGGGVSFDTLHGYYSELGDALSKDLPGDERAAITQARSSIADSMRKMAESDKKLSQFQEAQKNWSKYENTFNKTWGDSRGVASPIARALQSKDPVSGALLPDRIQQVLGGKNYTLAQQLLSRFKGAPTDLLQLMREKMDQAGTLPKTLKEKPTPTAPTEPPPIDPQQVKAQQLKKMAQSFSTSTPSRFEVRFPPLLVARRLMGAPMNWQWLRDWLSRPTEADYKAVKPSQVYPSAKAAAKATQRKP